MEVELETLLLYRYFKNPCGFCLQMGRGWTARRESSVTGEGELWQEGKNHPQLLHLIIPGKNPSHTYKIPVATLQCIGILDKDSSGHGDATVHMELGNLTCANGFACWLQLHCNENNRCEITPTVWCLRPDMIFNINSARAR